MTPTSRRWRAWIAEAAADTVLQAAAAAHPAETGGVLVGVQTAGRRPWVTEAVELRSSKATGTFYEVPAGARRKAVEKLRRRDTRLGYLGEWHVHPADLPPSPTDASTLVRLAADPESGCERPMLLVARRGSDGYRLDARQLHGSTLRALQIIVSGPLPHGQPPRTPHALRRRLYLALR